MTTKRSWKLQEFIGHSSMVTCASLGHKSGRVMATGGEDGKVNMWHVGSPNCLMSLSPLSSAVEVVHFNASEELICAGSRSGALRIWDLAASKVVRQLTGHKAAVRSLDFHPYGDFIVSGAVDHKVRMWDIRRKGCIFTYKGHEGQVNDVEFSPDGRWISSVSDDKSCKIWNITAGKLLHELKDHDAPVTCLQFHPNEFLLATGSQDRTSIVYDVEKIHRVSRSPVEAHSIQHIMFDDSGKYLYTASQDCCKLYAWEPTCVRLDTVLVKWGKPADVTISADQLMGCSFSKNIVSVHIIDTAQLQKTPNNKAEEEIAPDVSPLRTPYNPRPNFTHTTTRPHTSCGVPSVPAPKLPASDPKVVVISGHWSLVIITNSFYSNQGNLFKLNCVACREINNFNNNNLEPPFKDIDNDDATQIFNPRSTLSRSPVKPREPEPSEPKPKEKPNLDAKAPSPAKPTKVHSSVSNPEVRAPAQQSPRNPEPAKWVKSESRNQSELAQAPGKPEHNGVAGLDKQMDAVDVKKPLAALPLGGALNWLKPSAMPGKNENIPEKPGICPQNDPPVISSNPPPTISIQPSFGLSTTFVPNERQDPIGLDMNAFLPAKREKAPTSSADKTDADAIANIRKGFESMRVVLTNRHKNLEIVRALWTSGDIMTSIDAAVKMNDQALMVDLLNVLTLKPSLWNLDLCVVMLPQIKNLISSRYESYTSVGCQSLKLVLKNFAQVIRSNLKIPPSPVDISREERHKKCKSCYGELAQIKRALETKQQASGKIGSQFRELKILISTVE